MRGVVSTHRWAAAEGPSQTRGTTAVVGGVMPGLLARLRAAAEADPRTVWSPVVGTDGVAFAEEVLGGALPPALRLAYTLSNGGFGPGPLIGLPGGYESSWGDLLQTWQTLQRDPGWEEGWLPVIDW